MPIGKERMLEEILFDKYRIIGLLGKGGTAKVYLTEHIKLNTLRAIKCIPKNHPDYDLQLKEARILKNLKHSCIPIIYDIEEDEECSYIVEQYVEGDTLNVFVKKMGTLNEDIIIHLALQLCDLIQYLHSIPKPVLYLDLKPENIIIYENQLKLIDFGSAIYADEQVDSQHLYGTKGYAAPELYHKNKIDERSDVYGIGMLIYYMVTGLTPTKGIHGIDNIDSFRNCSKGLKLIINHCLKFNPSQRYASVSILSKKLSALLRKNKLHLKRDSVIRFRIAIAGSQARIGVTHFSFSLCQYLLQKKWPCIYIEKNNSQAIYSIKKCFDQSFRKEEIFSMEGIPMLEGSQTDLYDSLNHQILVEDYGCLRKDVFKEFLNADLKILILGSKDWELELTHQILNVVTEYKDIIYLFNYVDGRQFHRVIKNMKNRICYRIPYRPDPFSKNFDHNGYELFHDLEQMVLLLKGLSK